LKEEIRTLISGIQSVPAVGWAELEEHVMIDVIDVEKADELSILISAKTEYGIALLKLMEDQKRPLHPTKEEVIKAGEETFGQMPEPPDLKEILTENPLKKEEGDDATSKS
jgi:hypothetical protein